MVYDIRTTENAKQTLVNLTSVPLSVWESYAGREHEYKYTDDLVLDVIKKHGHLPKDFRAFQFVFFHITTSANKCASFFKHGILDLNKSYLCADSELRCFLENHGINIDLDARMLMYMGKKYDITFGRCPREDTKAYYCWSVGRKFYYDYTACGFLSIWERSPYGGLVHRRPEILSDIDNLLELNLSDRWETTHTPYEVVAKVSGDRIVYDGDDELSDTDKVIGYLTNAYCTAFGAPSEKVLLLKNGIQIPPTDILEVKPLEYWINS